jgi:hypothetical protein
MSHYDDEREVDVKTSKRAGVDKGGRPPVVLSDEEISQVEALGAVLSIEQIADYFSISKPTFYEIMKRQPDVSLRYKKGKAKAIGNIAKSLLTKAQGGDNVAMIFYLKTQAGWKETQTLEHVEVVTDSGKHDW